MLSVTLIERCFRGRRFEQLLDNLAANGLELPLPLRVRLAESPASPVALGLRRLVDLTYGPTSLSREMAGYLVVLQAPDGSFQGDPLATAAAAAAMGKLLADRNHRAGAAPLEGPRERALAALAAMQSPDGLFCAPNDRTDQDRALTAAFVIYLLARDDDFRQAIRSADLFDWFEQHQETLDPQAARVWSLARTGAPNPTPLSPAVAAIAA